jgi:hypothetical protein
MRCLCLCWTAVSALALSAHSATAAERMIDLLRDGYRVLYTEPYLSFDGCDYDKAWKVGPFIFLCRSYDYIYHYGEADLLEGNGSYYLCLGEDSCISGDLGGQPIPRRASVPPVQAEFYRRTENTRMMVQFDLVRSAGLTPEQRKAKETSAAAAFMPACAKPYTEPLGALLGAAANAVQATRDLSPLDPLPAQAVALDVEFEKCMSRFGVIGYNYVETADGQEHRVPEYLAWAAEPLREFMGGQQGNAATLLGSIGAMVRSRSPKAPRANCTVNVQACR